MSQKKVDFGKFLSGLAAKAEPATQETLAALQAKMKEEQQKRLEQRLRVVFDDMERTVGRLRQIRKDERALLAQIQKLEETANKIVAGEDTED